MVFRPSRPVLPRLLAVSALALLCAGAARADVVYDAHTGTNLAFADGANDSLSPVGFSFQIPAALAPKTPSVSLDLRLDAAKTLGDGAVVVSIAPDAGGLSAPAAGSGTVVGSVLDSALTDTFALQTFSFSPDVLSGGVNGEYWVLVTFADNSVAELALNDGTPAGLGTDGQLNFIYASGNLGIYADTGGAYGAIVDTPEPASIALLGCGVAGVCAFRRRAAQRVF